MATTFTLKRRNYSFVPENNEPKVYRLQRNYAEGEQPQENKGGLSTGAKVGLGIAGTALAAGGAFMGARGGLFGAKAMKATNSWVSKAGTAIKGDGQGMLSKLGTRMENSGNARMAKADLWSRGGNIRSGWNETLKTGTGYKGSAQHTQDLSNQAARRGYAGSVRNAGANLGGGLRNIGR